MCEVQANYETALLPLGTCGCCQHGDPGALGHWHQQLSSVHRHIQAELQRMGDCLDSLLSRGTGQPLLSRQVFWLERGRRCGKWGWLLCPGDRGFWQGSSVFPRLVARGFKPLICAGEICVSCRTGCACACRRGVPLVGRHRG